MMYTFHSRRACPLCDAPAPPPLRDLPFDAPPLSEVLRRAYGTRIPLERLAGGRFILCRCGGCGALYQAQILDSEGLTALYDEWIPSEQSQAKKQTVPLQARLGLARQIVQALHALGQTPAETRALDLGLGWGSWMLMARALGLEVEGTELSQARADHARAQGLSVVSSIAPERYHFINAEQVFEHLAEPRSLLAECAAGLVAGGLLRIAVPNGAGMGRALQTKSWRPDDWVSQPLEHINIFTPASLRRFGESAGLRAFTPPLVLPTFGLRWQDVRYVGGVLGTHLLGRMGLYRPTSLWFYKPVV